MHIHQANIKVQLLCDEGAVLDVVDLDGNTVILHAAKNKHIEAKNKHIEIISYLLGKGARSDVHNKDGDSLTSLKCRKRII